jgi:streptogramin lyase
VQWEQWRVARIDPRTRLIRTILRGEPHPSRRLHATPKLRIPYDLERDSAGRIWIADGGRHQVLRYVPRTRKLTVVAPRAGWDEVVDIAFDRAGNAYVSDVSRGRVQRIAPNGSVSTAAELEAPAALSLDPTGRYLAISSLAGAVRRLDLTTGRLELLAREGLDRPHGLAYDRDGNLFIADPPDRVLKLSTSGALTTVARTLVYRVYFAPDGRLFAIGGTQNGGQVKRIHPNGSTTVVAGTGGVTKHRDRVKATRVGIGPTALAFRSNRVMLVAQTLPLPAIRRVDLATGLITTVLRGR